VTDLWFKLVAMQPRVLVRREKDQTDSEIASEQTYSVVYRSLGHRPSSRDRAETKATTRLSRITSLTVITLLSVGLWAAIWASVSSLAAVWLQ
jgi:hypothetical protein